MEAMNDRLHRTRSLLKVMERSIDDARRRRLGIEAIVPVPASPGPARMKATRIERSDERRAG